MSKKTIESVLEENAKRLMGLHGVVGIAQGKCVGEPCINVYVTRKTPELLEQIPSTLEGYTVSIVESGQFRALET